MDFWIKLAIITVIGVFVYREILTTVSDTSQRPVPLKPKAGFLSFIGIGAAVGGFVYFGMSVTLIETRDLRPYHHSPQMVSLFEKGVIELNGMVIKTNLADPGELAPLAEQLTGGCRGNDGCEVQNIFDYVTRIPYKSDYTSRNPKHVIAEGWGDCDDKSNLFASLLNERGIEYRFVYVPHHVFVVVHLNDTRDLPFLRARLNIDGKNYYYAETTAAGARIGEFNGQFPYTFKGIYDIQNNQPVDLGKVSFRLG